MKGHSTDEDSTAQETVVRTEYRASTNRMLRVAVNSFMDNLALVMEIMEKLDVDVLDPSNPVGASVESPAS